MNPDCKTQPENIRSHIPLAPCTTFGVGGAARFFIEARTTGEIDEALAFARSRSLPLFVLGGGSNIVVADEGFDGLVLAMRTADITSTREGDRLLVTADAGVVWDGLVQWTVAHGLAGLECLSGVPGTVGGAVVANVGAYGSQCSDTFVCAEVIDLHSANNEPKVWEKSACRFSYHDSAFGGELGRYLVLRATFALSAGGASAIAYRDSRFSMADFVSRNGREPSLADIREAVLDVREQKGTLCMEGRLSYKSAGSFFHMPYVSAEAYREIASRAHARDAEREERLRPWAWEEPDGRYKIAPGFLLEYTEFQKGYVRGNAGISPKHTLSIINTGGARACEIAALARDMQDAVEKIFGLRLEREVEYVGGVESEK